VTTRYGFEGDEPKTGTASAAEKPNVAKTVFGHEVHLPSMPGGVQPPMAAAVTPEEIEPAKEPRRTNQPTMMAGSQYAAEAPSPQAKQGLGPASTSPKRVSQRPAKGAEQSKSAVQSAPTDANGVRQGVARFLGRRNTAGNIVPLTQTEIQLPKTPWVRPALTVGLAAIGSFLIVAALLWLLGPKPPASVKVTPERTVVQPPKPLVAAPPTPPSSPAPNPFIESPPETPPVQRANMRSLRPKAGRVRRAKSADPDAPLPPTFF